VWVCGTRGRAGVGARRLARHIAVDAHTPRTCKKPLCRWCCAACSSRTSSRPCCSAGTCRAPSARSTCVDVVVVVAPVCVEECMTLMHVSHHSRAHNALQPPATHTVHTARGAVMAAVSKVSPRLPTRVLCPAADAPPTVANHQPLVHPLWAPNHCAATQPPLWSRGSTRSTAPKGVSFCRCRQQKGSQPRTGVSKTCRSVRVDPFALSRMLAAAATSAGTPVCLSRQRRGVFRMVRLSGVGIFTWCAGGAGLCCTIAPAHRSA
jgi:hypothetical protein